MKTNIHIPTPAPRTHEGAVAARLSTEEQLRRSIMANMLWEDTFYESGVEIATRIATLIKDFLREEDNAPERLVQMAVEARTDMKLRHVPLLLIAALAHANVTATRAVVADGLVRVIQRPDELGEFVSLYWNGKRQMLPAQVKKGLAAALAGFSEYELAKWDSASAAVKLRDVLFLSHACPTTTEQEALYKRIAEGKLATPDTWEVALSGGADKKETFTRLMEEGKLGALALLRNLRNMQESGVPDALIKSALTTMKVERVLPFRFITAARYAPKLEPELESAMFRCLKDHPRLTGKTVIVVDNSGSMGWGGVSAKSELTRADAAAALAMLVREVCDDVVVIGFGDRAQILPPRRGFGLRDVIKEGPGGATHTRLALELAATERYDRIIVITDEQSHDTIPDPLRGTNAYFINVATDKNGIGYGPWLHIDGWSEAVLSYIIRHEQS